MRTWPARPRHEQQMISRRRDPALLSRDRGRDGTQINLIGLTCTHLWRVIERRSAGSGRYWPRSEKGPKW